MVEAFLKWLDKRYVTKAEYEKELEKRVLEIKKLYAQIDDLFKAEYERCEKSIFDLEQKLTKQQTQQKLNEPPRVVRTRTFSEFEEQMAQLAQELRTS